MPSWAARCSQKHVVTCTAFNLLLLLHKLQPFGKGSRCVSIFGTTLLPLPQKKAYQLLVTQPPNWNNLKDTILRFERSNLVCNSLKPHINFDSTFRQLKRLMFLRIKLATDTSRRGLATRLNTCTDKAGRKWVDQHPPAPWSPLSVWCSEVCHAAGGDEVGTSVQYTYQINIGFKWKARAYFSWKNQTNPK